jgi:autotransporter-associated beta strand protein
MEGFVGLGFNTGAASRERSWLNGLRGSASHAALALAAATLLSASAWADVDAGQTVKISTISGNTTLAGGTLQLDGTAATYSRDFTFKDSTSSTIDAYGNTSTLSGKLTGKGNITFTNSTGTGGTITLTNSGNDFTGTTTIGSGVTLALLDSDTSSDTNGTSGTIATSQRLTINTGGTFDVHGAVNSITLVSLAGGGNIVLGSNSLSLNDYNSNDTTTPYATNTTYGGVISGTGGLALTSGEITLTGVNTLTGAVTVSSDTMHLKGDGSIAQASAVVIYGTLDATGVTTAGGVSLKSLSGSGTVALGANNLTLTAASGAFTGIITTTQKLILTSGTQYLGGGSNVFGQGITVTGGTLQLGGYSSDITLGYNVDNAGTLEYYSNYAVTMNGVVSGAGIVNKNGSGIATITTAQTYTGATTITAGTLKLTGAGGIAQSSGVEVDSIFDLTESTDAAIQSLSGSGTVRLGEKSLAITAGAGEFSGTITGSGTLTISGGAQTLSGTNTYTGATTVTGGKLVLIAGSSLKSAVALNGGNLDLSAGVTSTGNATIKSLAGSGTVSLGANTLVLSAASDTYAGVMTGTGGLWITSGSETLSGNSTYTGTTTVTSGTLVLTGSLAATSKLNINGTFDATNASGTTLTFTSLAGTGSVAVGAHGLVLNTASGTSTVFAGVISDKIVGNVSGGASLTVSGSGIQVLSGDNTYTGGTTISSGATLQIGNGNTKGSVIGNVVDNGTLRFYRLDSSTFANTISGSGSVVQAGIGTTILTGTNTYSGTTTISAGTLQIGDGTTTGSIAGTTGIVDNGTLAFSPAAGTTTTINTAISGSGNVSILTGTVILTSANTYEGVTRIAKNATLVLTDTANLTHSDSVAINGTLDLTGLTAGTTLTSLSGENTGAVNLGTQNLILSSASTTFAGVITGSGGITLQSGTQILTGASTGYTGPTVLNGGTLTVSGAGSIENSAVAVNSGATLTGTGKVGAITVASGGAVQAGAAGAGTLTSTGNVTFASGSSYVVDMTSAGASKLVTSGTATLAVDGSNKGLSAIKINSADGTYALGTPLTVLTASGGITGTFSTSTIDLFTAANGTKFTSKLGTVSTGSTITGITLQVDLANLSNALGTTATRNQLAVAGGVDKAIAANSTVPPAFAALGNLSSGTLASATEQLSGEIGADTTLAAKSAFTPFLDIMSQRTAMVRPLGKGQTLPLETWVSGYASTDVVASNADTGAHKFRSNVYGVAAGAQWMPWANTLIGAALSAGTSDFRVEGGLGKGSATSFQAGIYGYMQTSRHFYTSFEAAAGGSQIKTTRVVGLSGSTDTLTGKLTAYTFGGRFETGAQMKYFTPYIAVQDHVSMLPGYNESAASGANTFALDYASRTYNSGRAEIGIRHFIDVDVTPRWILTPDFTVHINDRVAYAYDLSDGARTGATFVNLPSSAFDVYGAKAKRHGLLATVGADVLFNNGVRITTHLDTAFTEKSQNFTGFAGIGYTW